MRTINLLDYVDPDEYSTYLQEARYLHYMTQEEFAWKLNISRPYYSQIETGFYPCPNKLLERISKALNVNVNILRQKMTGRRFLKGKMNRFSNQIIGGRQFRVTPGKE